MMIYGTGEWDDFGEFGEFGEGDEFDLEGISLLIEELSDRISQALIEMGAANDQGVCARSWCRLMGYVSNYFGFISLKVGSGIPDREEKKELLSILKDDCAILQSQSHEISIKFLKDTFAMMQWCEE